MIISIEDNLFDLKNYLIEQGYEVYNFSARNASDVYIYSESSMGLLNITNTAEPMNSGSLFIDADGKSFSEIKFTIEHRAYTQIF